jgi:hypothetical protein
VLDRLEIDWGDPDDDEVRHPGIFSLVVDDPAKRLRQLPSLYHGNAQIFASRDVAEVARRLSSTIRIVLESSTRPSYLVTACRVEERPGLYARDVFNRDPFRLRAARAGLVLSDEPHVHMTEDGTFECAGWPPFRPEFIVVNPVPGRTPEHDIHRGAFLAFTFGILRVGAMGPAELRHLMETIRTATVVAADDPGALTGRLRAVFS